MPTTHDLRLVLLSLVIAVIASYTALDLAGRVKGPGRFRSNWLIGGAVVMGAGIWSMHFVAMLAFHLPQPITYDVPTVLLSVIVAIVGAGGALLLVSRPTLNYVQWLGGGVFMGLAIAAMHYIGMAAMQVQAVAHYNLLLVALSVVIAIVAALAALGLAFQLREETTAPVDRLKFVSALFMGAGISGMHYTGMAAVSFIPSKAVAVASSYTLDTSLLATAIGIATLVILGLTLLTSLFDQRISAEKDYGFLLEQKVEERTAQLAQANAEILTLNSVLKAQQEAAIDGILVIDENQKVVSYNHRFCQLWQIPDEFVESGDDRELLNFVLPSLKQPQVFMDRVEYLYAHPTEQSRDEIELNDGRTFDRYSGAILSAAGDYSGRVWYFRDISDRKQAEAALRRSELKYRNIFENSQVGIGRTRLEDGLFLDINQRGAEILGYGSPTDVIGKHSSSEFYANLSDRQRILADLQQHGKVNHLELPLPQPDGSIRWGMLALRLNLEEACIDFVIADISEAKRDEVVRKQAEEALQRSEQKFRYIFENSQVGIFRSRFSDGLVLDANQRLIEITGYRSTAEIIGQRSSAEFYTHLGDRLWVLDQLGKHGQVNDYEVQLRRRDGTKLWVLLSARLNPKENCVDGVLVDVTDRKRTEEALRESEQLLDVSFSQSLDGFFIMMLDKPVQWDDSVDKDKVLDYVFQHQRITKINDAMLAQYRGSREQFIGLTPNDLFAHNPAYGKDVWRGFFDAGKLRIETDERRLDGTAIWIEGNYICLYDSQGRIIGHFGVQRDISEAKRDEVIRKQAEQALREAEAAARANEQRIKSIVSNVPGVIYRGASDPDGTMEFISNEIETISGYPASDFLANQVRSFTSIIHPKDTTRVEQAVQQGVEARQPYMIEYRVVRADGTIRWVYEKGQGIFEDDRLLWLDGTIFDISEAKRDEAVRKQAESALQKSEQRLSLHVQQTPLAVIEWSPDFKLMDWNPGAEAIFGYLKNEVMGRNVIELLVPETTKEEVYKVCHDVLQQKGGSRSTNENLTKDGRTVICEWFNTPLIDPEGNVLTVASLGLDITDRKQAEAGLQQAKEAAEVANRAKSAFLANMSHELRTPLNAILGFAQLMERDAALTSRQREFLETINRSGEHLLSLINDVLEMSKIEAGRTVLNPAPFNLHWLLQTIQEMFQVRAGAKQLYLRVELASNLPQYLLGDEGKLRQVLINLLGNAIKFTDVGGVTLRVRAEQGGKITREQRSKGDLTQNPKFFGVSAQADDRLGVSADADIKDGASPEEIGKEIASPQAGEDSLSVGHSVTQNSSQLLHFEVVDTGKGIAAEDSAKLFQPFVQAVSAAEAREGTGLGLTISRQFAQLMGGDIRLTSKVNQGSTFYFNAEVELAEPFEATPPQVNGRVLGLAPGQPVYRILVVDDRKENCDLLTQLLKTVGFQARAAANGQEAIAHWQAWHPHVIWMDMRMPEMDGYEATRWIKAQPQGRSTVIIALTASAFEEQQSNIFAAGCDDLIRKPFQEQVIFDKLTEHLGVQYTHAEKTKVVSEQGEESLDPSLNLSSSDLKVMPAEWLAELHQAAIQVDADLIFRLIEQIPETNSSLAQRLTALARHFCFDEIIVLTQGDDKT